MSHSFSYFPHRHKLMLLAALAGAALLAMMCLPPVAQDLAYHSFADQRSIADLPNALNVLSNLPFVLLGVWGWLRLARLQVAQTRVAYRVLCLGVLGVGLGSAWYHASPDNASLIWDRLPIACSFMALFSILLQERVLHPYQSSTWLPTLLPFTAAGVLAVLYWYVTELQGAGDLRPYLLVQFLPVLLMPLILLLFPARYLNNRCLYLALVLYLLAKLFEHLDVPIWLTLGWLSGHSIKHLLAAGAVWALLLAVPVHAQTARRNRQQGRFNPNTQTRAATSPSHPFQ